MSFSEVLVDFFKRYVKSGQKIIIEQGNETMHMDLETGEWVSDTYVTHIEEWNPPDEL